MRNLFSLMLTLTLLLAVHSSITNTTNFFATESKTKLYYETYSGYEDIYSNGSASIYYSLWQGYNLGWEDKSVPLIVWLQGGPATSSQFGCFN